MTFLTRNFWLRCSAIGLGLVGGLLLVEAALRVLGISYPVFWVLDPVRGTALYPGASGWQIDEGRAYVSINGYGMRGPNYSLKKPPGTFRVAVLGDSFAEALQVARDETFSSVMEKKLQSCAALGGRRAEVLNFGISGHGTGQELLTLRHYVWQFDPDVVLLAFYTGNDVRNNDRALEGSPFRPYFTLRDGKLVLDESFKNRPEFSAARLRWNRLRVALLDKSYALQVARRAIKALVSPSTPGRDLSAGEAGINDEAFKAPASEAWREAWSVTEELIREMNHEVTARGRQFWLVTLSSGIQVNPNEEIRRQYMQKIGVTRLDYPDRRLAAFAERNGIRVITLLDPLRKFAVEHQVLLHGFDGRGTGHWNREGHRLAGSIISQRLCDAVKV